MHCWLWNQCRQTWYKHDGEQKFWLLKKWDMIWTTRTLRKWFLSSWSWNKLTSHEPEGEVETFLGSFGETERSPGRLQHLAAHIVLPLNNMKKKKLQTLYAFRKHRETFNFISLTSGSDTGRRLRRLWFGWFERLPEDWECRAAWRRRWTSPPSSETQFTGRLKWQAWRQIELITRYFTLTRINL